MSVKAENSCQKNGVKTFQIYWFRGWSSAGDNSDAGFYGVAISNQHFILRGELSEAFRSLLTKN